MRLKPVLDLARRLDIATNPDLLAIFEAGSAGFQVWCTPQDHPKSWEDIQMVPGAFSKPCEYVGSVHWKWEGEQIVALEIETSAYALTDQKPNEYCDLNDIPRGEKRRTIFNRDDDIEWLKDKVAWLFEQAGIPLLPLKYEQAPLARLGPYILAHYIASDGDDYVVIVSPNIDPQEFSQPGYELADTIEIWEAGEFPADMPLMPAYDYPEPDIEPDEGLLVEEDDWLEAAYEDRTSGWDE
jgi:hypothetical protein